MNEDAKSALKSFYQKVGEKYPEEEQVYRTLRGMLRRDFVLKKLSTMHGSLLDVGCNRGMYLAAYQGGDHFGIDLSLSVLKQIPKSFSFHLVQADAEKLQCFAPDCFDNVLCSEVLEHCLHPQAVFSGIAHVLKPGGLALLTTPNYRGARPEWIDLGVLRSYGVDCSCENGYYHTAYRPEELERMARDSGLQVISAGTLEKEIKYAAKIPAAILLSGRFINRVFKSARFARLNEAFFNQLSLAIYRFCHLTRLERLMLPFIREGVRSFIVMQKPSSKRAEVEL